MRAVIGQFAGRILLHGPRWPAKFKKFDQRFVAIMSFCPINNKLGPNNIASMATKTWVLKQ